MVPPDTVSSWLDGDEPVASLRVLSESTEYDSLKIPGDSNLFILSSVLFCFRGRDHVSLFSLGTEKRFPLGIILI